MNKALTAIALAVIMCLLVGPFATGIVAEQRLRERIAAMDANNPWLATKVTWYDRGWFTSVATVELSPILPGQSDFLDIPNGGPLLDLLTNPLPVRIQIGHGPVSLRESLHIGMAQVIARPDTADERVQAATQLLGVPYLFEFRGRAGFGSRFDFESEIPAFSYAGALGETNFSGLMATGFSDRRRLAIEGGTERISLQSPFAAGTLNGLGFDMSMEFRDDHIPVSSATTSIGSIIATSPMLGTEPVFELGNMTLQQSVEIESSGETVGATFSLASDLIATANGQRIENAALGFAATGIDAAATSGYYRIITDALAAPLDAPEQLLAELEPLADAIVRRGFSIVVDPAEFATELGAFAARAEIRIDGSALPADAPADIRDIGVLLNTLSVDMDVTVTKPLATRLAALATRPQLQAAGIQSGEPFTSAELDAAAEAQAGLMLVTLIGQGFIVDDGDDYTSSIRFGGGGLTINGVTQQGMLPVF